MRKQTPHLTHGATNNAYWLLRLRLKPGAWAEVRSVSRRLPGCLLALRSVEPQAACRPPAGGAGSKASRLVGVANSFSNCGQIVNNVSIR